MEVISRDVFETKLNLNLFKDMQKRLHKTSFVYFFFNFLKQLFNSKLKFWIKILNTVS